MKIWHLLRLDPQLTDTESDRNSEKVTDISTSSRLNSPEKNESQNGQTDSEKPSEEQVLSIREKSIEIEEPKIKIENEIATDVEDSLDSNLQGNTSSNKRKENTYNLKPVNCKRKKSDNEVEKSTIESNCL